MRLDSWLGSLIERTQNYVLGIIDMFGWPYNMPINLPGYAKHDPRLDPIDGDEIDELVNEQIARGLEALK